MIQDNNDDLELFICDCHTLEHQLVFQFDEENAEIVVSVHLNQYHSWYARIWIGLKYIFGFKSVDGAYDCVQLDSTKINRMKNILEKWNDKVQNRIEPILYV